MNDINRIVIDPEFQSLIPPLTDLERTLLEASILEEGINEPIELWPQPDGTGVIVDGHNRYAIALEHKLPYTVRERAFGSRSEAVEWIAQHQLGRRNLSPFARSELALRLKPAFQRMAKENMSKGGKGGANLPTLHVRKKLAEVAEVSERTLGKVQAVVERAPTYVSEMARSGEMSVDKAARLTDAFADAPQQVKQLAAQHKLVDPDAIRAWSVTAQRDPKLVVEAIETGAVINLDGESVPVAEADPTLVRVAGDEEAAERILRQRAVVKEAVDKQRAPRAFTICPCCGQKVYEKATTANGNGTPVEEVSEEVAPMPEPEAPAEPKRGRGRPKGSRNRVMGGLLDSQPEE